MLLFISAHQLWGQSSVSGTATYRFRVYGHVEHGGSACGKTIFGGLQWIAIIKEDGSYFTIVRGNTSYPNRKWGNRNC